MKSGSFENETLLIQALKEGEECAYRFLYDYYYQDLCVYMTTVCGSSTLASDIVQQTFIKLWRYRQGLVIHKNFKNYLFRIAYNLFIDDRRKRAKDQRLLESLRYTTVMTVLENNQDDFEEKLQLVREQIEQLPPACKRIFLLSKLEGLKYREIATKLDISVNTVEVQMGKALKRLRDQLKKQLLYLTLFF